MNEQEVRLELFNAIKNRLPIKYWENGTAEEVCEDLYKAIGYLEPYIPLVSLKSLEPKVKEIAKLREALERIVKHHELIGPITKLSATYNIAKSALDRKED